jgi:hypothetical protein
LQLVNADESIATGLGFVAREGSDPMITVSASSTAAQAFATLAENDMYAPPRVFQQRFAFFQTIVLFPVRAIRLVCRDVIKLVRARSSAAPIVDGDNHLIGTVSATDLRGVALGTDLSLNIMDFLSARHARGSGAPGMRCDLRLVPMRTNALVLVKGGGRGTRIDSLLAVFGRSRIQIFQSQEALRLDLRRLPVGVVLQ